MKKDLFTESRRMAHVTQRVREVLGRWNYNEIFLPTVERYDHGLRKGLKMATHDDFYLIKPDVTSQISVNVKDDLEHKLFYISEVLDGLWGEWQVGMEFIGGKEEEMQIEVLRIIIDILEKLEITEFYIDIGSFKVWSDAVKDVPEHQEDIFKALKSRNFGIIEELGLDDTKTEELWNLFNFRGKESGVPDLDRVVCEVNDPRIFLDLGTVRPLPYYDDVVLEVYSPDLGYPIGAGGSYRINGVDAFGFAFKLKGLVDLCLDKGVME